MIPISSCWKISKIHWW